MKAEFDGAAEPTIVDEGSEDSGDHERGQSNNLESNSDENMSDANKEVASKIKGQVAIDPNVNIDILKNHVQETYGLKIGKMTLYRAKAKARLEHKKNAYLNGYRPFIGVDGCHLKVETVVWKATKSSNKHDFDEA
ncbi:hypothetical protein WN943_016137 [Citrus x changshan-huyou]